MPRRARRHTPTVHASPVSRAPAAPLAPTLTRSARAGIGAAILTAWALLFGPQLFSGQVFVAGDAAAFRPYAEFSRQRWLEQRERTFWNPYVFAGIPATSSLADPRPQYLPGPAIDLLERAARAPFVPPLAWPLLAHLAGMLCVAALARGVWGAGAAAMTAGALGWGMMPNLVVPFAFGHDAQLASASLMPAVLLAIHHLFAARGRNAVGGAALSLATTLGLQCLAGHPQIVVYTALLAVAFALERASRFERRGRLAIAAAAAAAGAALGAAVWLPAWLYAAHSSRGGAAGVSLTEVSHFSHALRDLASLAWPGAVGFGGATYWGGMRATDYPQYLGATLVALMLFGSPPRRDPRFATWAFLVGVAAFAVLSSLGTGLGPLYALAARLPLFSLFRVPVAFLIVAQLAIVLLAAGAVDRVRDPGAGATKMRWLAIGALAAAALGLAIAFGPLHQPYVDVATSSRPGFALEPASAAARRAGLDFAFRAVLAAGVVAVLVTRRRRPRLGAVALAALVACDLGSVVAPLLSGATGAPARLAPPPPTPLARVAAADPLGRALSIERGSMLSNHWVSWRARSLTGVHTAVIGAWSELMERGLLRRYPALCALSVRYVWSDSSVQIDTSVVERVVEDGRALPVLRIKGALPRAYAVARVAAPGDDAAVREAVLDPGFDPGVAYARDAAAAGEYPGSRSCAIAWITDQPDRLELATDAPDRAFLVVADAHLPGWTARVDDRIVPLYRVNHLVRGVALPPGRHRVTMDYVPEGWRLGVVATRTAIALLAAALAALVLVRLRKERERAGGP